MGSYVVVLLIASLVNPSMGVLSTASGSKQQTKPRHHQPETHETLITTQKHRVQKHTHERTQEGDYINTGEGDYTNIGEEDMGEEGKDQEEDDDEEDGENEDEDENEVSDGEELENDQDQVEVEEEADEGKLIYGETELAGVLVVLAVKTSLLN
jgi:hypothetical protein